MWSEMVFLNTDIGGCGWKSKPDHDPDTNRDGSDADSVYSVKFKAV
jgi:hypothetical protein